MKYNGYVDYKFTRTSINKKQVVDNSFCLKNTKKNLAMFNNC